MKILNSKGSLVTTRSRADKPLSQVGDHPYATAAMVGVAAVAISAFVNRRLAKDAERRNPPKGQFLEIDGVRLHYVERGKGEPLVLLHGNGSMIQGLQSSGLLDKAAKKYRVIVFDRPGYGHSRRPRGTLWTPEAQADLIHEALQELDATPAIVLGHSWGASVAVALGLKHEDSVKALVLASGYYYPTARVDVAAASGAGDPDPRRHPSLHAGASPRPHRVAGLDAEDLRTGGSPAEIHHRAFRQDLRFAPLSSARVRRNLP